MAGTLGVAVRVEPFETPPAEGGGRCVLDGRPLVLVDARAPLRMRVRTLAGALAGPGLDEVFVTPAARELIEACAPSAAPVEGAPLAPLTTLGVGGPAALRVEARDEAAVLDALRLAARRGLDVHVLGGGSNVVVADGGVTGLVLRVGLRGVTVRPSGDRVEVEVGAGEVWDDVVRLSVERGWAGLECLSGIPGQVGATPIQNVGAYGQEMSDTVASVRVADRGTGRVTVLGAEACGFGYRDSVFRSAASGRYVVLAVTFALRADGRPAPVRYAELAGHLAARGIDDPGLADVRAGVLALRRAKSMVLDEADENRRSCGSFFLNPVVDGRLADEVARRAGDPAMPRWPGPGDRVKLAAAWLIERAGYPRGLRDGPVGLSSRHALAIVAHEGARASDVVRLARRIRDGVAARFGVALRPEPVFWGFPHLDDGGLPLG